MLFSPSRFPFLLSTRPRVGLQGLTQQREERARETGPHLCTQFRSTVGKSEAPFDLTTSIYFSAPRSSSPQLVMRTERLTATVDWCPYLGMPRWSRLQYNSIPPRSPIFSVAFSCGMPFIQQIPNSFLFACTISGFARSSQAATTIILESGIPD